MINVTIVGTGDIASTMATTLKSLTDDFKLYGVVSRSFDKGKAFAKRYQIEKVFTSLEEVVEDNKTNLVYIGTPHTLHYSQSKFFLENKIPVLCEKPMTVNADELIDLIETSKNNQTLLVDATWSRYMPFSKDVKALANKHNLGRLLNIHSSLGIQKQDVNRMINPELAGGSLLDVGIYPVNVACLFNEHEVMDIKASAIMTDTNVDQSVTTLLTFSDGMMATLQSSIGSILSDKSTLSYEQGLIELHGIPKVKQVIVKNIEHEIVDSIHYDYLTGYEYELFETQEAIKNNVIEPKSLSHKESLRVISILDEIRKQIDLVYPFEKEGN